MSDIFSAEEVASLLASKCQGLELFFTNLAKEELSKVGNEYSDNDAEKSATMSIIDSVKATVTVSGSTISLSFSFGDSEWMNVIEGGVSGQVLGGDNGTVTYPDGHTEPSRVPPQLWGTPFPEGYEPPSHIQENIKTMATTLFEAEVSELINSEDIESALAEKVAAYLQERLGG